jgi:hypothetical protein
MNTREVILVTCPQCQARYNTPITPIISVGSDPTLKQAFLRGELNISQCPQCGFTNELNIPVLYHDSAKELAFVLTPNNLQLSHQDAQKLIGDLTNKLMNSLPPEERKAYLFTPKTFLTLDSLKKAILEADGITEEMLQSQAAKVKLLEEMLQTREPTQLKKLVEEHDSELDQQFFEILSATIFNALANNAHEQAQGLLAFRQMIAEWSSQGKNIVAEIDKQAGFQLMNPETLLENLKQAEGDEEFMDLIRTGKPLIDYTFFQNLTSQIDTLTVQGNQAEAERLKALRSRILNASAQVEEENRKIIAKATRLLSELTQTSDPKSLISEKIDQFDDTFFAILIANAQDAEKRGQKDVAQKLMNLQDQIMSVIQEKMPPEMRLLNQLLQVESPDLIKPTLEQNRTLITPQFMELLQRVKASLESRGQQALLSLLLNIQTEAEALQQDSSVILRP